MCLETESTAKPNKVKRGCGGLLTLSKPLLAKVHKSELDCSTFNTTFPNPCWLRWPVNATQTRRLNIFCPLDVSRVIEHSLPQRVPRQSSCCGCSTEGTWCPNRPLWSPASLQPSPSAGGPVSSCIMQRDDRAAVALEWCMLQVLFHAGEGF